MNANITHQKTVLSLHDENISYSNFIALKNVTLSISEGDKVAVIGPSGAGKSTLLRRLFDLHPDQCASVHQNNMLVPQLTTFHNIYMGRLDRNTVFQNLRNLIKPSAASIKEIRPIVNRLGLADKLFSRVGELSGGQLQRVGIGRAVYQGGTILLADEPVSSLDQVQQEEIMKLIISSGKTVISALHSIRLAQQFFNRVIGLKDKFILFDLPVGSVNDTHLEELYA